MPLRFSKKCNQARDELRAAREEKEQRHREAEETRQRFSETERQGDFD